VRLKNALGGIRAWKGVIRPLGDGPMANPSSQAWSGKHWTGAKEGVRLYARTVPPWPLQCMDTWQLVNACGSGLDRCQSDGGRPDSVQCLEALWMVSRTCQNVSVHLDDTRSDGGSDGGVQRVAGDRWRVMVSWFEWDTW
jgi:hypothetical protein